MAQMPLPVQSLRELCQICISAMIPVHTCIVGKSLLQYLSPSDMLEVVDRFMTLHGRQVNVNPYELLLPTPSVLLQMPHLRVKLHKICGRASRAKASKSARDLVLNSIPPNDSAQLGVSGLLDLGAFLCETGWYDDGTDILRSISSIVRADTSPQHSIIALDCAQRCLNAALACGRVETSRRLADHVQRLMVGQHGALAASALLALARFNILIESWSEATRLLCAAADVLPSAAALDDLQPDPESSWYLDKMIVECLWMDEKIPSLLETRNGRGHAQVLSRRIVHVLDLAAVRCEDMFGGHSLRLSRILTEQARQYFSSALDGLLDLDEITRGCLYAYSSLRLLFQAEAIFRSALKICYHSGQRQHLDLVEHCLRGLSSIYAQHEDVARSHSTAELLETVISRLGVCRSSASLVAVPGAGYVIVMML
ncbi:uncharacterized protein LOC119089880 [Pollicipes pollicipes]|uniref:uncharacterized protein LOC119089880 n=1 Tax=Pollicipes pollicipes TaxID=41117 RepID=UPI001885696A|nr:uncharacterized protein LOC119089880 [Pollicipes pollicipes]